jgi:L-threonylcarbamoyladenylate synthase
MIHLDIKLRVVKPATINLVAGSLKKGKIAVLPTDTIYGFSGLADDVRVIKKIKRLKKRHQGYANKPFLILISDLTMLKKYAYVSDRQAILLKKIWGPNTRPTTVILRSRGRLPKELLGSADGLAVRLPKSEFLIKIIKKVKRPLISTSLNISGQENINDLRLVLRYWPLRSCQPDLLIDAGVIRQKKASRLLDLRPAGKPLILRK